MEVIQNDEGPGIGGSGYRGRGLKKRFRLRGKRRDVTDFLSERRKAPTEKTENDDERLPLEEHRLSAL